MSTTPTVATFDGEAPAGTVNFGLGQPSADLLPLDLVADAAAAFFRSGEPKELNYGVLAGDARFLDSLAGFLAAGYATDVLPEQLMVTPGASQGLDLATMILSRPGDTIFVEEPSFFLAFQIFRDHQLEIVGIPTDDDGLDTNALREALKIHSPTLLYTIPSFHNPGGTCTTAERRREIVELAAEHDFLVIADEVYQLLDYYDAAPPAYGTMVESGRVASLGSFSKILAPGMRLGWIQTCADIRNRLLSAGHINSGGSLNHISSLIVRQAIDSGSLDAHIDHLRNAYRSRLKTMNEALHEHFDGIANWHTPAGGYFMWIRFDDSIDTTPLKSAAAAAETGFQPGTVFSTRDNLRNCLRLSFAHYREDDIAKGIARLRTLFD